LISLTCLVVLGSGASAAFASPLPPEEPAQQPGSEVAELAEQFVGTPYRWGGASPAGFDCTGFVMYVYSQFGVSLPHNVAGQLGSGERVSSDELEPGDVLVFANTYRGGLSHTGIYVGDGQFVHAADERHGVMVSSLGDGYWSSHLAGATRAIA
jgi:cell wall-associated NlpC family hydrolase